MGIKNILIKIYNKVYKKYICGVIYSFKSFHYYINYNFIDNIIDIDCLEKNTNFSDENTEEIERLIVKKYLNHEIDLLGSGWVKLDYGNFSVGFEGNRYTTSITEFKLKKIINKKNYKYSEKLSKLIDREYIHIDWSKDFRSGFRYNSKKHRNLIKIGSPNGVDIKWPWELSRMQHLLRMAIISIKLDEGNRKKIIREFKNEVLDFFVTNPLEFGVNWVCTMDVSIRLANMLLAYDILEQLDNEDILNKEFKEIFSGNCRFHLDFIYNNLENKGVSGNHYLSNLAGLIIGGAYFKENTYLKFGIEEFFKEFYRQFNEDGSSFEASTAYHRLSSDIVGMVTTFLIYIKENNIECSEIISRHMNSNFFTRLSRLLDFNKDILKENGTIIFIGDNDSGKFINISPIGELVSSDKIIKKYKNFNVDNINSEKYFDENFGNNESTITLLSSIFNINYKNYINEQALVKSIIRDCYLPSCSSVMDNLKNIDLIDEKLRSNLPFNQTHRIKINITDIEKMVMKYYKNFGLYCLKADKFSFYLYAGEVGYEGKGSHSHNDKMNIEVFSDGKDILVDPGCYVYTADEDKRDIYRSSLAHNIPIPRIGDCEQNRFIHMFETSNEVKCKFIEIKENIVSVRCEYRDKVFIRTIRIENHYIEVDDRANIDFIQNFNYKLYSNGYGKEMYIY
ncbi:heparinase II/III domain-containing protein [Clostridium sp. LP20]|uniref:heparinase II/III domain-containing protein n=1 Tax=Clostridium sp. LP20 TaxID=3418665 RepID=UPI003EE42DF3